MLISCSKNEESQFIKYSEIGDTQANDQVNTKSPPTRAQSVSLALNTKHLELKIDSIIAIESNEFMDRFKHIDNQKSILFSDNDSIHFRSWTYQDSIDSFNAFFNLMDCFSENCSSIDLYSTNYESDEYNLLFHTEYSLYWIQANRNQQINIWERFIKIEFDASEYKHIIEQKSKETINWFKQDIKSNTMELINHNYGINK